MHAISISYEEKQNMSLQNMFELIIFEEKQTQEEFKEQSKIYLFVKEMCIYKVNLHFQKSLPLAGRGRNWTQVWGGRCLHERVVQGGLIRVGAAFGKETPPQRVSKTKWDERACVWKAAQNGMLKPQEGLRERPPRWGGMEAGGWLAWHEASDTKGSEKDVHSVEHPGRWYQMPHNVREAST